MSLASIPSAPADLELIAQLKSKLQYAELRIWLLEERLRLMRIERYGGNPYAMHFVERLSRWAGHYVDLSALDLRGALVRSLEQISHFLFSWGTHFLSNIVSSLVEAIIWTCPHF